MNKTTLLAEAPPQQMPYAHLDPIVDYLLANGNKLAYDFGGEVIARVSIVTFRPRSILMDWREILFSLPRSAWGEQET